MRKSLAVSCALLSAGCSVEFPDKFATGITETRTAIRSQQAREASVIHAFQDENWSLRYISRDTYSCGDPQSDEIKRSINIEDTLKYVKTTYPANKTLDEAAETLRLYGEFIAATVQRQKVATDTITALANGLASVSSIAGGASAYFGLATPAGTIAARLFKAQDDMNARAVAKENHNKLIVLHAFLAQNATRLNAAAQAQFNIWDQCARERLRYIRDAPIDLVKSGTKIYPSYISQSTGMELAQAFVAYRERRRILSGGDDLIEMLDKIIQQNKAIIESSDSFDLKEFFDATKEAADLAKANIDAAKASDKYNADRRARRLSGTD